MSIFKKVRELLPDGGLWLSVAACFMLFIYAPLEIYFLNKEEFWFDFSILFPILFVTFIIFLFLSMFVLTCVNVLNKKLYEMIRTVYFVAFICTYIQGNFLVKSLPPLDGTEVDWRNYSAERIKCIALWLIISAMVILIWKLVSTERFCRFVKGLPVFITLMLFLTLIIELVLYDGFEKKPQLSVTTASEFRMSSNSNFIILVLDSVEGTAFSKLLESDDKYAQMFKDFTYYDNTVGGYPYTKNSIPLILSGKWYENDIQFKEFVSDSFKASPFLNRLEDDFYEMGIYETGLPLNSSHMDRFNNLISSKGRVTSYVDFATWQVMMVGWKYAPFDLKRFCFICPVSFNDLKVLPEEYTTWSSNNIRFYKEIQNGNVSITENNVFKFIHIEGAHPPMQYDENVEIIKNGTYEQNVKASLTIADAYLNKLREAEVYDNSIIVIMADHGYNDNPNYGKQNPILFVKGLGEHHDLYVSNAPISFDDLQEGYMGLLDGKIGNEIFDVDENEERDRRYLWYVIGEEDSMIEYMQTGQAGNASTLKPTGKKFVWSENEKNLDINQVGIQMN